MKKGINDLLLDARKAAGLTQAELAAVSGVDSAAISHYECGRRIPSTRSMMALAKSLGVSLDYLAGATEPAKKKARKKAKAKRGKKR